MGEKGRHAVTAQGFTKDNMLTVIHGMYLEDIFCQVETNTFNIHDGHLLQLTVGTPQSGTLMP